MTILAEGTVAATQTAIFTANQSEIFDSANFTIEKITFFSTVQQNQTAILYLQKRFQTAIKIRQFVMRQFNGGEYLEPGEFMRLENGDELQAETTQAGVVNFAIIGERTT